MTASTPPRTRCRRAAVLAAGLTLTAGVLAACSDDDSPSAGPTSPTNTRTAVTYAGMPAPQWAAAVCDGLTGWQRAAAALAQPLPARDAATIARELTNRLDTAATATTDLAEALRKAGAPAAASGDSARMQLDPVTTQLDIAGSVVKTLAEGTVGDPTEAKTRMSQATAALKNADTSARSAMITISQLEPAGKLGRALAGHPSCKAWTAPSR